jgi:Rad3-related DNA helicase
MTLLLAIARISNNQVYLSHQPTYTPITWCSLPSRDLLVLDEEHLLEGEIIRFRGLSISRKKYIPDLKIENHGYDVRGWVEFLVRLKETMSVFINMLAEELLVEATQDIDRLLLTIGDIISNPTNWIVSDIQKER